MPRLLLQDSSDSSTELSPEATAGFILGFTVVGFLLLALACFSFMQSRAVQALEARVALLEHHPRLVAKEERAKE